MTLDSEKIKSAVRQRYTNIASKRSTVNCCGPTSITSAAKLFVQGYSADEVGSLPSSVITMSAGCGNPTGLGMIKEGESVLDLGSGGGIDVFLASRKVGPRGKVVGLDMTPLMVERAEANARRMKLANVEFKLGEIEHLPLADDSMDVIISNCVICLSPDKPAVFREMFRVLKPGGRLAIADEVAIKPFSDDERADPQEWSSCVTGAITEVEYVANLKHVGFANVHLKRLRPPIPATKAYSAFVSASKPL